MVVVALRRQTSDLNSGAWLAVQMYSYAVFVLQVQVPTHCAHYLHTPRHLSGHYIHFVCARSDHWTLKSDCM